MKITCITTLCTFIGFPNGVSAFHYEMFHGSPRRKDKKPPFMENYSLGERGSESLRLVRSGHQVPDIACPSCNWIVRPAVREVLVNFPPIDFLPVIISKAIDVNFEPGDFSWYDRKPFVDPERIDDRFPDCQSLRKNLADLSEVLLTEVGDLPRKVAIRKMAVTFARGKNTEDYELHIPVELLESGAIVRQRTVQMLPERAMEALESFFDWRFYHRMEVTI